MLLVGEGAVSAIQTSLVSACHSLRDTSGQRYMPGTIDGVVLRAAALAALSVIAGTAVDTAIDHVPTQRQS